MADVQYCKYRKTIQIAKTSTVTIATECSHLIPLGSPDFFVSLPKMRKFKLS